MPKYSYQACTDAGNVIEGILEASSVETAETMIRNEGYTPLKVWVKNSLLNLFFEKIQSVFNRVKIDTLVVFTRQFRSLLVAGVPILRTLEILLQQTESKKLKEIVRKILFDLEGGSDLSSALAKFPLVFSELYINTIKAGEASGVLPDILDRLADYMEYEDKIKKEVKAALRYPVLVFVAISITALVFTVFVIPRFAAVLSAFHMELPLASKIVFATSTFIKDHFTLILVGIVFVVLGIRFFLHSEKGRTFWDRVKLRIPVFGDIFRKLVLFRFAWMLKILYQSGLPIIRGLRIVSHTLQNRLYEEEIRKASIRVEAGESLSSYLLESRYFPPMVVHMIATGEHSGNLDQMLGEISKHYDMELKYKIRNLTSLIEPLVTTFLAAGIFILALALFLPMWNLLLVSK